MKKIKTLAVTLLILAGCTNFQIGRSKPQVIQGNNIQKEVVPPSEILKELEKEFSSKEKKPQESIEPLPNLEDLREEIKKELRYELEKEFENKQNTKENIKVEEVKTPAKVSKEQKAVNNFINLEVLRHSNISINIVDLKTGKSLASYEKDKSLTPASVMKVVTTGAALEELGANTKLKTRLVYDGAIDGSGNLGGNLYIIGGGDPTLGSDGLKNDPTAFMGDWITKVKGAGIKSVGGDIIVIDNLFGYIGPEEKWLWEDFGTNYGQGTYGISVFDNLYTLHIASTENSAKVTKIEPEIYDLKLENNLTISPRGRKEFAVKGLPLDNKRVIYGEVPKNVTFTTKSDIPNPGVFLGKYLKANLEKNGVAVKGKVKSSKTTNKRPNNPKTLAITYSPTISQIAKILLERSDNHYTEHLYALLKLQDVEVAKFWESKGIDVKGLDMYDGSGLSRRDVVTSKILTDILVYMYKNYPEFKNMLPRAGYDGTVAEFLKPQIFNGVVRIKSGSMGGIQSYAGYINKNGKEYAFAIIVNHWNGSRAKLKAEMERLIIGLF